MILLTLAPHRWPYKTLMFSKCFQTVVVRVVYDLFKSQNNEILNLLIVSFESSQVTLQNVSVEMQEVNPIQFIIFYVRIMLSVLKFMLPSMSIYFKMLPSSPYSCELQTGLTKAGYLTFFENYQQSGFFQNTDISFLCNSMCKSNVKVSVLMA